MLTNIINIICLFNLAVLVVLLWCRRSNTYANFFLGGLVFLTFTALIGNFTMYQLYYPYAFFKKFEMGITFLFGYFLWSYINQLLGIKVKINKIYFLHFLPTFAMMLLFIKDCFLNERAQNLVIQEIVAGLHVEYNILNLLFVIHTFTYIIYCHFYIKKYEIKSSQFYSNSDFIKISWARQFIYTLIFLNIAAIIAYSISLIFPGITAKTIELIYIPVIASGMQLYIVYKAFHNSTILTQKEFENYSMKLVEFNEFRIEDSKSPLNKENEEELYSKVLQLLEKEKIYLEEDLNLKKFSEISTIQVHQLSQIINYHFNKNFSELINHYRVEEAKKLFIQKPYFTIEAIAYEAGFGSKATFHRVFKKQTGLTPSEFIKQLSPPQFSGR